MVGKRPKASRNRRQKRSRGGGKNWLYLVITIALVVVIGLGATLIFGGSPPASPSLTPGTAITLPAWLNGAPWQVRNAYAYAALHPETTSYVPCYCGCGEHSGHKSLQDCFVASRRADGSVLSYDRHGANCAMCVNDTLTTERMIGEGSSVRAVRQFIDDRYSGLGLRPTDTPPPP